MMEKITELKLKVDTAERERDFYFDKLRDIEIIKSPQKEEQSAQIALRYL